MTEKVLYNVGRKLQSLPYNYECTNTKSEKDPFRYGSKLDGTFQTFHTIRFINWLPFLSPLEKIDL